MWLALGEAEKAPDPVDSHVFSLGCLFHGNRRRYPREIETAFIPSANPTTH